LLEVARYAALYRCAHRSAPMKEAIGATGDLLEGAIKACTTAQHARLACEPLTLAIGEIYADARWQTDLGAWLQHTLLSTSTKASVRLASVHCRCRMILGRASHDASLASLHILAIADVVATSWKALLAMNCSAANLLKEWLQVCVVAVVHLRIAFETARTLRMTGLAVVAVRAVTTVDAQASGKSPAAEAWKSGGSCCGQCCCASCQRRR